MGPAIPGMGPAIACGTCDHLRSLVGPLHGACNRRCVDLRSLAGPSASSLHLVPCDNKSAISIAHDQVYNGRQACRSVGFYIKEKLEERTMHITHVNSVEECLHIY